MKKLFIITILMALTISGFTQILHYDFSAVCETGQTLYYLITSEEEHTVTLTHPYSEENNYFQGDYYEGFTKPQGEIILPSFVEHNDIQYSVTAIDANALFNCADLTGNLTIPEGIVSLESRAFSSCNFTAISIPQSLEVIVSANYGYGTAFANCSSLESISVNDENPVFYSENNAIIRREGKIMVQGCKTTTIPDDVEAIGQSAFQGVGDGGDLVIPNSIKTINDYAFYACQFSGTITFSDSLQNIGCCAFENSSFSGSLTIPNSVTEIEVGTFANCSNLTGDLALPSSISTISARSFAGVGCTGALIIPNSVICIEREAFQHCDFSELVLGNSVEMIGDWAFRSMYSNTHLTGILRLPTSLTAIGRGAFAYNSFDEIYSPNTIPPTLSNSAFDNYTSIDIPIHIPLGCTEAYQNAEGWNRFTNFVESEINPEGSEWYYEILNEDGSITYQHLQCAGDTTINNERPKVIVRSNTQYDRDSIHTKVTHEYVYEKNGKFYWWNKDLAEFTVLYDLAANAGDEWEIKVGLESLTMHVDSVGYFEYEGRNFRILHVSDPDDLFSGNIVCGIGHLTNFFPERLMNRGKGFRVEGMRCYWVNGNLVFKNGDEDCDAIYAEWHDGIEEDGPSTPSTGSGNAGALVVYPNPANNILFVETRLIASLPDPTYHITNLMGQTMMTGTMDPVEMRHGTSLQQIDISGLPSGMYFITVGGQTVKFVKQ